MRTDSIYYYTRALESSEGEDSPHFLVDIYSTAAEYKTKKGEALAKGELDRAQDYQVAFKIVMLDISEYHIDTSDPSYQLLKAAADHRRNEAIFFLQGNPEKARAAGNAATAAIDSVNQVD